jgi:ubiquinone/menaquinone biosynthesis C-methylase UbiE
LVMSGEVYVRALPRAEGTPTLYSARYALREFDRGSCKRILDLGCGDAFFEERYPRRFVGLDIERTRLTEDHRRGIGNLILGNGRALPFATASFDGVLMKDVLEHFYLEQAFQVLYEVTRVLAIGGLLAVTTTKDTQSFWDKPDHVRPYSNRWVRRVLEQELGRYRLVAARELSGGIRGFGVLRLEWLAHALAQHLGIRNTHGVLVLQRTE